MAEYTSVRGNACIAFAIALVGAPLAVAHGQPAASAHAVRTRVLAWPGGDRLFIAVNADVRYQPGTDAKVVVTGPDEDIDDLVVDGGVIRDENPRWGWGWRWWRWWGWRSPRPVHIVVTAPRLSDVGASGSGRLDLGRLAQDRLTVEISGSGGVDVSGQFRSLSVSVSGSGAARLTELNVQDMSAGLSGSGWIKASGAAGSLRLSISGSGGADMGALQVQDVEANLSGSGSAVLSPKRTANVGVSGSGAIRLLTEPARLNARRSGSGAIIHPGGVS